MLTIILETNANCAQKVQYPICEIKVPTLIIASIRFHAKQAIHVQAYSGPEVSKKLRLPGFSTIGT